MDSQDLRNLHEAYSNVYEQQIGVPLKDASDRAAKEQLKKMIPKGEKIHTPKATLQNASYEPDAFDAILEYLVSEGYADTNENALVIMANMSEEWMDDIMEKKYGPDEKLPGSGLTPSQKYRIQRKKFKKSKDKTGRQKAERMSQNYYIGTTKQQYDNFGIGN